MSINHGSIVSVPLCLSSYLYLLYSLKVLLFPVKGLFSVNVIVCGYYCSMSVYLLSSADYEINFKEPSLLEDLRLIEISQLLCRTR